MRILALGSYCEPVAGDPPPLKGLVEATTGISVRRIGRFIQLALIGAGRCLQPGTAPAHTAVFLASGRGDLEVTLEVLREIFEHRAAPMPLSFVNTVSNSACYYLARTLRLNGRSAFATSRYAPFESALRLAALDLATGIPAALVGVVDVCVAPVADHRQRVGVSADREVGEGSHWLLLAPAASAGSGLGRIPVVRGFTGQGALSVWLEDQRGHAAGSVIAPGQHLGEGALAELQDAAGISDIFDYRAGLPYFDSQAGAAVPAFLQRCTARRMVHIDSDPGGRFQVMVVERS